MTHIWGSSAYGGSVSEWTRIDNKLRSVNGNKGMQIRRSYASSVPSSFEASDAYQDYTKRVSAMSIAVDPEQMAAGDFDNKLRTYVNDVPSDHTIYLGYFHEPEDNMTPGTFGPAWARFAQVILNEGNTNIIPSGCLMAYTFQVGSGRDEHAWVPGELLSGPERDACLFGIDGYAREVPTQRTPNWLFDYPWQVIRDEGFDRVGIFETGVNQESPRKQWMLNLETHVNSRDVEVICWWHSHVFAEGRWFYIELDTVPQAEPDSWKTWADIISRNQDDSAPVVVVPPGDLPDPDDPPPGDPGDPGGGGGTPVPWNPNPGTFTVAGIALVLTEWSPDGLVGSKRKLLAVSGGQIVDEMVLEDDPQYVHFGQFGASGAYLLHWTFSSPTFHLYLRRFDWDGTALIAQTDVEMLSYSAASPLGATFRPTVFENYITPDGLHLIGRDQTSSSNRFHLYTLDPETNEATDTSVVSGSSGTSFVGWRGRGVAGGWVITRWQGVGGDEVRFASIVAEDGDWTFTDEYLEKADEDSVYALTGSTSQVLVIHPESTSALDPNQYFGLSRDLTSTNDLEIDPWGESSEESPDFTFEEWGFVNAGLVGQTLVTNYLVRTGFSEERDTGTYVLRQTRLTLAGSLSKGTSVDLHGEELVLPLFDPDFMRGDVYAAGQFLHQHMETWDAAGAELQVSTAVTADTVPVEGAGFFYGFYDHPAEVAGTAEIPNLDGEFESRERVFPRGPTNYTG